VVESRGIETFVFQAGGSPKEIFERDLTQLKSSDILIAEVSERSHGVGVEIGLSYILGLKRILLIENGNEVTKLVQGIPDTVILKYTNEDDLKGKLDNYLQNLLEKQSVGIY
jgi:nucleoside 2-deoxyribosyltransferase